MHRSFVVVVVAGCATASNAPPISSSPVEMRQGLKFANPAFGKAHAKQSGHIDLPFQLRADGVNGTALLIGFLQKLDVGSAVYISDVSYSLQMVYKGMAVECVSKIIVDDGTSTPAPPAAREPASDADFTTEVAPWQPGMVDRRVVDRDMHCAPHGVSVEHVVAKYPVEYAAEVKRNLHPEAWSIKQDGSRIESQYETTSEVTFTDECSFSPLDHEVHRYEHFVAAKFMPPDLELVRKLYSNFRLVEAPPECHRIERSGNAPLRQHLTADVHYSGAVILKEPDVNETMTSKPLLRRKQLH